METSVGSAAIIAVVSSTSRLVPDAACADRSSPSRTWVAAAAICAAASSSDVPGPRRVPDGSGTAGGIRTTVPTARPGLTPMPVTVRGRCRARS